MRIIDRYLLRGFFAALFYCLALFFILFIVVDVFNHLDEFLKHGLSLRVVIYYYLYLIPSIFVQVVPVAVLVALLYVLGNLNRHYEILAFKASGISGFHILAPYLFVGLLLSFGVFLLNEKIVPQSAVNSAAIMEGLIEKGKKNFDDHTVRNVSLFTKGNMMVFAREFETSTSTLFDVVLFEDNARGLVQNKLTAKKARYDEEEGWTFYEVIRYQMNRRGELTSEPDFSDVRHVDLGATPADFLKESTQVEFMNMRQLGEMLDHLQGSSRKLARKLSVDFHSKIAFPFVCFIVILIGSPLAMQNVRSGLMQGLAVSVAIVMVYFGVNSICLALGKGGLLPPVFAAWFGNLFFAAIGIYLIKTTS